MTAPMPDQPQTDIMQTLRDFCEMGLEGGDADPLIEVMHSVGASAAAEITRLRAENARLQSDCAEAYQAVGAMANALGYWKMPPEHPDHLPITNLLDILSAAAAGDPRPHDDLLPFVLAQVLATRDEEGAHMTDIPDRPEIITMTIREARVSGGEMTDTTFDLWCDELRSLARAEPLRYGPDPIEACGPECWRDYYDDGYSPRAAWAEDGAYN